MLKASGKSQRDVVILTDGQRHGWADPKALERWELLAGGTPEGDMPNLWVVNVVPDRGRRLPNWSLLTDSIVAGSGRRRPRSQVQDGVATAWTRGDATAGQGEDRNRRPARGRIRPPSIAEKGRIPLTITQRFTTPGSHLVTLTIDEDAMPGDNRQDFAVEVMPTLPVLIVGGDGRNATQPIVRLPARCAGPGCSTPTRASCSASSRPASSRPIY